MTIAQTNTLQSSLDQIATQVPRPVMDRIEAAIAEIDRSGVAPGLAVGDVAPDFTLPDQLGRPVSLRDRLKSGPVVLTFLRYWVSDCAICSSNALQDV